ncbi:MAG TPA: S41 family peptidase, partial [Balneolaceae bacterium]|nr:S41 family peptidase [Balneolaceae bacterium]
GGYGGIGLEAGYRGDQIVIIAPMEGYPADRAGLLPGDIILKINDLQTSDLTPEEVQQLTVGDIGSEVTLTIRRPGLETEIDYTLQRERIDVKNVSFAGRFGERKEFAYLQLSRFGQNSAEEVREQLISFNREQQLEGLILDLRNNPGGLLNESVDIVDKFIEPGVTVVETRGRHEAQNNVYATEETPLFEDLPLVVLINNGSASASEIVSGAFQDLDRGVVVGEKSFGKGLVQIVKPLSYNTSIKITVSKYFIPSGRSIQAIDYSGSDYEKQNTAEENRYRSVFKTKNGRTVYDGKGIEPDIVIPKEKPSILETALMQRNHFFFFVNDYISQNGSNEFNEGIFDEFIAYLQNQKFDYETEADRHLALLEENLDLFSGAKEAEEHLNNLEEMLADKKKENISENRDNIYKMLELEWVTRKKGQVERQKLMLENDEAFRRAMNLLGNKEEYQTILKP